MINSQADRNIFVKKQTEFSNTKKIQQKLEPTSSESGI